MAVAPSPEGRRALLRPPAYLSKDEAAVFRKIVAGAPAEHFVETDEPLLAAMATAIMLSRKGARSAMSDQGAVVVWERATRMMAVLATKLRLAPQSRIDAKTVGRRSAARQSSYYDHMDEDDAD